MKQQSGRSLKFYKEERRALTTAARTFTFKMRVGFAFAVIVTTFAAFTTPFTLEGADAMEVFNEAPTLTEENYAEEIPAEEEIVGEEEDDDFLSVDGVHLLDTKGQTIRFKESVYEDLNIMCYKGKNFCE